MKITVWGINYAPELTGIAPYNQALCDYLCTKGHSVRMVTGFPYYPGWIKQATDAHRGYRSEKIGRVRVYRCWQYVPRKPNALKRILHEFSFVATSFVRQLFLPRPDVMVVISPPLLLGAAAWLLTRIKPAPFFFHVQDLQPDAAYALGLLKKGWLARILYGLEAFAYRHAVKVSGISQGMSDAFHRKGVPRSKTALFPNGVSLPELAGLPAAGAFRQRHHLAKDDFIVTYSGNLGVKQGLEVLVEAARRVRLCSVRIVICGDGARREALARQVAESGLRNVIMLPLQPEKEFYEMLVDTNLAVITQETGTGQFFFPSKLLRILALGKPVLTVADGTSELAGALERGGFGLNVEPRQPGRLAEAIEKLAHHVNLQNMGDAGREFVRQFEFAKVLGDFEAVIQGRLGRPLLPYRTPLLRVVAGRPMDGAA